MKHLLGATLLAAAIVLPSVAAHADVAISVGFAPPAIPVYAQPPIPGDGYMWTPGYWAWSYDSNDYYWVPGTWVFAPFVGALWTPGYWGWFGGSYIWHGGYWGTHIGYYGGINYGHGYAGVGYQGGYWHNGSLRYNQTVNNFGGTRITNVYNAPVNAGNNTHVSYNGGVGGVRAAPTPEQKNANFQHYMPTSAQQSQEQVARTQPQMHATANAGHPAITSTRMPGQFQTPNNAAPRNISAPGPNYGGQQTAQRPQSTPTSNSQMQSPRPAPAPQMRQVSATQHSYAPRQQSYAPPTMHQSAPSMSHSAPRMMSQHQSPSQHSHFR